MQSFSDIKVLVTGGSRGIGAEIVRTFLNAGAEVASISRSGRKPAGCSESNKLNCIKCDVTIESEYIAALQKLGEIDILVNNVGGGGEFTELPFHSKPTAEWRATFELNVMSAVIAVNELLPHMIKKQFGRIVSISSVHGKEAGGRPWYTMSKSALIGLMGSWSKNCNVVSQGITFNTVCAGAVHFKGNGWDVLKKENPQKFSERVSSIPSGRIGTPSDVAESVLFLSSAASSWINGATLSVDGGQSNSF